MCAHSCSSDYSRRKVHGLTLTASFLSSRRVSYESFWARTLLIKLRDMSNKPVAEDRMVSIDELAELTAFTQQVPRGV